MSARNILIRELDAPPTVLRSLAARQAERYPVLFDSAAEGPLSRLSILAALPTAALWADRDGRLHARGSVPQACLDVARSATGSRFLDALQSWWISERVPERPDDPPFAGGWVLFASYEMAQEVEPHLDLPPSRLPWRAFALRTPCAIIHERATGRLYAIAEPESAHLLDQVVGDVRAAAEALAAEPQSGDSGAGDAQGVRVAAVREEDPQAFLRRVQLAKEYIRAGHIYQANLSRPWRIELEAEPDIQALYARLCKANPAPFAALVQWDGVALLSSSPERLARVSQGRIDTRPIAGTRPRSRRPGDDLAEMTELAAHPKERAEHVMLIDLERNDLGRVCEAGTVHVDELMIIESYAHVHHIVSNVSGRLRADVSPVAALRAVFPGGTITGCPKVRCMQIIAELEGEGRGAYTGSLGFLGRNGSMDTNILIRTMTLVGREIELRAGAGIVADSDPLRELEETRAKARGLLAVFDTPAVGERAR